ncbi:MAG: spermidine synthase [Thiomicrorhabdus sp.]|nr:MAG: spermidine synthase [Thiomicrorhabdus sp.]
MTKLAGLTFLFAGSSTLIYQISWLRLLNTTLSSTTTTTVLILTSLLGGLVFGSLIAQWRLRNGQNGLTGLVISQIIVAISALLLLPLFISPDPIVSRLPDHNIESIFGFISLFLILLIPATAMGMSFPFFTTWFAEVKQQNSQVISSLYALFTLGGAIGVLLTGFYLIPNFGLDGAIYFAAALNILAVLLILLIRTKVPTLFSKSVTTESIKQPWRFSALLIVLATCSFALIGTEIIWTRYLSLYTGTTLYGYTAIAALILTGLAIGSVLMQHWQNKNNIGFKHLFWLLITLFLALILTKSILSYLPFIYSKTNYLGELLNTTDAFYFGLLLLPATLLFGAIFPLALALYCLDIKGIRSNFGFAFSVKILAAIISTIATYTWLIPTIGSNNSLIIFACAPLVSALFMLPQFKSSKHNLLSYIPILALFILPFLTPNLSFKDTFNQNFYRHQMNKVPDDYYYLAEADSGIISLVDYDNSRVYLQLNGLTKSSALASSLYKGSISESLTGALPFLLQENPTNAFVIGFKTGTTTRILANSDLDFVKTIEMDQQVVKGMLLFGLRNFPFLEMGLAEVEYGDARVNLKKDPDLYSIITSQPSHAWLSGANAFYSKEFFELVKSRLKEDGIFAHTFSLLYIDTQLFKSILNTFYSVFPKGAIFSDLETGELILLGGNNTLVMDYERSKSYYDNQEIANILHFGGLRNISMLPNYYLFSSETAKEASAGAEIITDTNLLVETHTYKPWEDLPKGKKDPYQLLKQYVQQKANNTLIGKD